MWWFIRGRRLMAPRKHLAHVQIEALVSQKPTHVRPHLPNLVLCQGSAGGRILQLKEGWIAQEFGAGVLQDAGHACRPSVRPADVGQSMRKREAAEENTFPPW